MMVERTVDCMIGLGTWAFELKTPVFSGTLHLTISDRNGQYEFKPELPGYNGTFDYEVLSIKEEGNTLSGELTTSFIPMKKPVKLAMTFAGDRCAAIAKVPLLGKVKVQGKLIGGGGR